MGSVFFDMNPTLFCIKSMLSVLVQCVAVNVGKKHLLTSSVFHAFTIYGALFLDISSVFRPLSLPAPVGLGACIGVLLVVVQCATKARMPVSLFVASGQRTPEPGT